MDQALDVVVWLTDLFVLIAGLTVIGVLCIYVIDRFQTTHSLRRNFSVLARFRYLFEDLDEFFRQYIFAMDRGELPFNSAERSWVCRAAKDVDTNSVRPVIYVPPDRYCL